MVPELTKSPDSFIRCKQVANPVLIFHVLKVPVHVFLDFSTLECRHLSESVELFVLDLMDSTVNYTNREVKVSDSK